ncbi:MAG: sugar transporter [Geobacteraceae bacterium GWC2_58_44]|nr:MAG: sugar transporter [Geobacteraceae bacterium GWC2_58_44]HBG05036.1 sugar transporter [Geobacter sp.]
MTQGLSLITLLLWVTVSGCARYSDLPAGTLQLIGPPVLAREEVSVPAPPHEPPPAREYRVGSGDVLLVSVSGRPEFSVTTPGGAGRVQGSRVDGSGALHLPLLGSVQVEGLTLSEIEQKLTAVLKKYLQEPWVVVEVAEYKSAPLFLLGQFKASGTYYLDRPMTLMQGVALGNGFDTAANLKGARLTRGGRIIPVDLYALLSNGDVGQNIWLKGGDTVYIPDNRNQQVFIFGAVKKPGAVAMPPGGFNLAQAIASAELRDTGYDFRHVRIIRSLSTTRGELMVVDYDRVLRGEALPMQLSEGDIIYVPKSGFGTWNDVIAEILPSLQAVSAILQPFVQIRFLSK